MFKKVGFEHIIKSKTATGVEIILLPDATYEMNVVSLKKNKSDLAIEKKHSGLTEIASLVTIVDSKNPIILVINGKGIIHRKVSVSENDSLAVIVSKALPNANLSDFYVQKRDLNSSQSYISIVRSSVINELIDSLKKNSITNIAEIFLGPFVVNSALPLINSAIISNEFLMFANHKLLIREGQIQEVLSLENDSTNPVKVGDDLLEGKLLISFAAALSYFVSTDKGIINSEVVDVVKDDFKQKQKFQLFGWSILVSTFMILMINYFVFSHYWQKSNEMNTTLVLNQSALKRVELLNAEYSQKKEFLEENGLLENSQTSYYADRLAASIPSSIQLIDMDIHPLKKKDPNDLSNAFYFENKIIKISGKCDRNTELNDWMKTLKTNNWVADVNLVNYKQENAREEGLFFLEIKLK